MPTSSNADTDDGLNVNGQQTPESQKPTTFPPASFERERDDWGAANTAVLSLQEPRNTGTANTAVLSLQEPRNTGTDINISLPD